MNWKKKSNIGMEKSILQCTHTHTEIHSRVFKCTMSELKFLQRPFSKMEMYVLYFRRISFRAYRSCSCLAYCKASYDSQKEEVEKRKIAPTRDSCKRQNNKDEKSMQKIRCSHILSFCLVLYAMLLVDPLGAILESVVTVFSQRSASIDQISG